MGIELKYPMKILTMDSIAKAKHEPDRVQSLQNGTAFSTLAKQAGVLNRYRAERAASREAAKHFTGLRTTSIQAEARIATASLKTAETQIMTALTAAATTQIGALLLDLNARTAAVQLRLTSASSGELTAHLQNRKETVAAIKEMTSDGDVTADESAVLIALAASNATDDIERSLRRSVRTKEAVDALYDVALGGVAGRKNDAG